MSFTLTSNNNSLTNTQIHGTRKGMGLWVWGPTDTGKSTQIPVEVFDKGSNKWWDGYMQEEVVLFDDPKPDWAGASLCVRIA